MLNVANMILIKTKLLTYEVYEMARELESRKKKYDIKTDTKVYDDEPKSNLDNKDDQSNIVIEQNKEPKNMLERIDKQNKAVHEAQRKYLATHKDVNVKNANVSRMRALILKNKLLTDYDMATKTARELYDKGITRQKDILAYFISQKEQKTQEPEHNEPSAKREGEG